jgi:hypothetical protein
MLGKTVVRLLVALALLTPILVVADVVTSSSGISWT